MSATLYGGGGNLIVPNNETRPDEYEVIRMGMGVLGVVRPWAAPANGSRETSGFFAALGGSFELDRSLHSVCGYECPSGSSQEGERHLGKHFAARLGFGYSFPIFEFRVGALVAIPDPNVSYAMPLLLPDVMARIGPRDIGWFEVGLGAYSASTNFRPGLYIGGAVGSERVLQVSAHVGAHLVNGLCCGTVTIGGLAGDLSVAHAFSNSLSGSVGATLFRATWSSEEYFVGEG
ncbi:MAG TPA: hypothetical protein VHM25_00560, partial [Polyangiaceae bacterium]|nr:hypothetical protein [Polyangiaceae bacterium]